MGIFSEWQPQYEQHGLVTFPVHIVGKEKRPYGGAWHSVGRPGSRALAERFRDCDAFGVNLERERLTVLDVDSPKERDLIEAMRDFGPSPFVVKSGSGNFQAYYRSRGEKRQIRPIPGRSIDILGIGSFAVAAPSQGSKGRYDFIEGSLDDLRSLPSMTATVEEVKGTAAPKAALGERNRSLFEACMRQAPSCSTSDELTAFARDYSEAGCIEPLPEAEVIKTALSAWNYEQKGANRFGRGREIRLGHDLVNELSEMPEAFVLWARIQVEHWNRPEFILANAMAGALGWTLPRFRAARDFLAAKGLIECTHRGGRGPNDPPRYRVTV